MKIFRVGNIIEINGNICQVVQTTETGIVAAHHTEPGEEFEEKLDFVPWKNTDELIKDIELSNFLLDKMFREDEKRGFSSFYYVWFVDTDIEIREATEGFNILWCGFELFKIFSVREFQNVYAVMCENPIIGFREKRDRKTPGELDDKLRDIFKIG